MVTGDGGDDISMVTRKKVVQMVLLMDMTMAMAVVLVVL